MAARRAPVFKLLEKLRVSPIRSASATPRSFSTETRDLAESARTLDIDRRHNYSPVPLPRRRRRRGGRRPGDFLSSFFSDAFDPFDPTWSLMDQMVESSFTAERPGWDVREDENALYLRMEMPGLGKEDVRVKVEQNTLVIKGESPEEEEWEGEEEESGRRRYSSRIDLPPNLYKIEDIKAEMKNGVLKVVVPKVKDEERQDVFLVPIQ
ncbi:small heat shock protein, chloroplastic [Elaeis guineensis]|uniref:Small heat shock protein, chloroplastic n=1 Tax=Elaeis guineensis var. tenera TaxID=51953 RepID=A0A6I9QY98_ELAGV|nr:small heat shock protein, chloroplastic [Elaeis guineensis]XP_010917313.1 small heat shock protein, chloroplastic [Elaeis guineensis]